MELTVLGNNGGFPKGDNACSSFLIQTDEANFLFDCGPGCISKLGEVISIDALTGIFISHFHQDHYSDLLCVVHAYEIGAELFGWKPLTVYSPTPPNELRKVIETSYINNVYFDQLPGNEMTLFHEDLILEIQKIKHSNGYDSYALNVFNNEQKISFTGDMKCWSEKDANFFKKADILVADAQTPSSYHDEDSKHLSPTDAIRLGEKADVDRIILTHFYPVFEFSEYMNEIQNSVPKKPVYLPKSLESFIA